MQARPKTFSEFQKQVIIVNRPGGGVKIICKLKDYVILETKLKPWNTPAMRKTFLGNMYIRQILMRVSEMKHIQRPPGYDLLGRRKQFRSQPVVICDAFEGVNPETGEMQTLVTICYIHKYPNSTEAPFKTLIVNLN